MRLGFNLHPAYRTSGGRVEYVAPDLSHMRVRLRRCTRRTRNVFGTLFGGSLFAVTDGPLPTMLMAALGPDVVVWDQEASIHFQAAGAGDALCRLSHHARRRLAADACRAWRATANVRRSYTGRTQG